MKNLVLLSSASHDGDIHHESNTLKFVKEICPFSDYEVILNDQIIYKKGIIPMKNIKVEEYTSPTLITLGPDATLDQALDLMQENSIRHLPILKNQEVIGVVSERDLFTHIGKSWHKMLKVEDIMSTSILSVYVNDSLGDVAFQLSSQKKGSAIVLDNDSKLYGIFTTTDALNALVELFYPIGRSET